MFARPHRRPPGEQRPRAVPDQEPEWSVTLPGPRTAKPQSQAGSLRPVHCSPAPTPYTAAAGARFPNKDASGCLDMSSEIPAINNKCVKQIV